MPEIYIEPPRFAQTGAGMHCHKLRQDMYPYGAMDSDVGALDAPGWIPAGYVRRVSGELLMVTTEPREGNW